MYIIWAEGEQLWWDDVKKHGYPKNWQHGPLPTKPIKDVEKEKDDREKNGTYLSKEDMAHNDKQSTIDFKKENEYEEKETEISQDKTIQNT